MKTSSFKNYKGDNGIAICIYPPTDWSGPRFPALEPERADFYKIKGGSMSNEEYEESYRKNVLARLDAQKIYDSLKDYVLLCWEKPGDFCHRRIVAAWLFESLGIIVDEWNPLDELDKKGNSVQLF